jgi:hypothetical protein
MDSNQTDEPTHDDESNALPRVMIDIETLGTDPGAAIVSIGAVRFDAGTLGETLFRTVDFVSCEAVGLHIDAETLDWWLHRSDKAQEQLTDGVTITTALNDLAVFIDGVEEVWANSPSFDCAILEAAYEAAEMDVPWDFWQMRDFRTLKNLPVAPDIDHDGIEHDALDDAKHQAHVAAAALKRMQEASDE